eukprot:GGOE01045554.1.p1 GENE.GGOE01045554.1~~GGOE01045554.1.p1  ORF type:complete len:465 (+),score=41.75 GGOE01045554.1:66-1460(+)
MGCGPSACEKNITVVRGPNHRSSSPRPVLHVGTVAAVRRRGVLNESPISSRNDHNLRNSRLLHRRMLALRETLEYELNYQGQDDDETSMQERQLRVDELLAQMMFEEELSSLDLGYFRRNRWHIRSPRPPRTSEEPAVSPGLSSEEVEDVSVRKTYKKEDHVNHDEEKTYCYECILCLAEYEDGDELRAFRCDHTFHVTCVDEWLKRSKACPLCSEDILAQTVKEVMPTAPSPSHLSQFGHSEVFSLSTTTAEPNSAAMAEGVHPRSSVERTDQSNFGHTGGSDVMEGDVVPTSPLPTALVQDPEWSLKPLAHLSSSSCPPISSIIPTFPNPSCSIIGPEGPDSLVLAQPNYIDDCQVRFSPISGSSHSSHHSFQADQPQRSCSPVVPSSPQRNGTEDWEGPAFTDDGSSHGHFSEDLGCNVARLPGEVPWDNTQPFNAGNSFSFGPRQKQVLRFPLRPRPATR